MELSLSLPWLFHRKQHENQNKEIVLFPFHFHMLVPRAFSMFSAIFPMWFYEAFLVIDCLFLIQEFSNALLVIERCDLLSLFATAAKTVVHRRITLASTPRWRSTNCVVSTCSSSCFASFPSPSPSPPPFSCSQTLAALILLTGTTTIPSGTLISYYLLF